MCPMTAALTQEVLALIHGQLAGLDTQSAKVELYSLLRVVSVVQAEVTCTSQ